MWLGLGLIAAALVLPAKARAQDKPTVVEEPLAAPKVTLSLLTPSALRRWTLTITNNDEVPVRVVADSRLLTLLVAPKGKTYTECSAPKSAPANVGRELVLKPGESYREEFDPRWFCFGKLVDELGEGTSVTAFLGYKLDPQRVRANKPQVAPFLVEPSQAPATFLSEKRLVSLTTYIPAPEAASGGAKGTKPKTDEPVQLNTSRLLVDPLRLVDATTLQDARASAAVKNVGDRPALVHLRTDELEFQITLPGGGAATCSRARHRAPVRDFFHTIPPKGSENLSVLLAEACPRELFRQPGVYEIRTILHAPEDGKGLGLSAVTGDFEAIHTTLLRLQRAKDGFYRSAPKAVEPKK